MPCFYLNDLIYAECDPHVIYLLSSRNSVRRDPAPSPSPQQLACFWQHPSAWFQLSKEPEFATTFTYIMPTVEDRRVLDVPLERAWRIAKNSHELLPQLMPEVFESIDLEEGDGGPGSIFVLTMGPAMPGGRGRIVRERVDLRDDERHKLKHTTIEGGDPRYSSFTSTIKYERGPYRGSSIRTWSAKYTPAAGVSAPPPEDMKRLTEKITDAIHNYASENPDYCAY